MAILRVDVIGLASQMMVQVHVVPKEAQMPVLNASENLPTGDWLHFGIHARSQRWDSEIRWSMWIIKDKLRHGSCVRFATLELLAVPTMVLRLASAVVTSCIRDCLGGGITEQESLQQAGCQKTGFMRCFKRSFQRMEERFFFFLVFLYLFDCAGF